MLASDFSPAGQESLSERDVFFDEYRRQLAAGKSITEARAIADAKADAYQDAKEEALNDGLSESQATVVGQKVAEKGKEYSAAVEETTGENAYFTKIKAGAIKVEQFVIDNLIPILIALFGFIAAVVFVLFTKPGQAVAKAIGAPVKRS